MAGAWEIFGFPLWDEDAHGRLDVDRWELMKAAIDQRAAEIRKQQQS